MAVKTVGSLFNVCRKFLLPFATLLWTMCTVPSEPGTVSTTSSMPFQARPVVWFWGNLATSWSPLMHSCGRDGNVALFIQSFIVSSQPALRYGEY